jgi:hypothetical protein
MHLILSMILVMNGELVKFTCDVVSGATIHVPIRVYPIISGSRPGILALVAFIIAMPIINCLMISFATDLACQLAGSSLIRLLEGFVATTTKVATATTATMTTTTATGVVAMTSVS